MVTTEEMKRCSLNVHGRLLVLSRDAQILSVWLTASRLFKRYVTLTLTFTHTYPNKHSHIHVPLTGLKNIALITVPQLSTSSI